MATDTDPFYDEPELEQLSRRRRGAGAADCLSRHGPALCGRRTGPAPARRSLPPPAGPGTHGAANRGAAAPARSCADRGRNGHRQVLCLPDPGHLVGHARGGQHVEQGTDGPVVAQGRACTAGDRPAAHQGGAAQGPLELPLRAAHARSDTPRSGSCPASAATWSVCRRAWRGCPPATWRRWACRPAWQRISPSISAAAKAVSAPSSVPASSSALGPLPSRPIWSLRTTRCSASARCSRPTPRCPCGRC